jgi:hypothetical protein
MMPRRREQSEREAVFTLLDAGLTHGEVSRRTGVPVNTIRTWIKRGRDERPRCPTCGLDPHDLVTLDPEAYAYLLASYLGDGCVYATGRSYLLRITLDVAYPEIIRETAEAMSAVRGRPVRIDPDSRGKQCVNLFSSWKSWPCVFPQHGPGRKHSRPIVLEPWQQAIVDEAPEAFLRGLIHTDGWRGLNKVTVKGKDYAYPRYQFSNRSDDIRKLFTDTCDKLGIEWRRWGRWHISVAKRDAVARMDEFVGLKA